MIRQFADHGDGRAAIGMAALLAYSVLLGGTALGEVHPGLRAVNAVIGAVLIIWYARRPGAPDRVDLLTLAAAILLCFAATLSALPRQSFDAAIGAVGLVAALHHARRVFVSDRSRRLILVTMMSLSAVLTLVTAARWMAPYLEWWALTGWSVMPPLELRLNAQPWGHRHDLALLIVMLYPSWWAGTWRQRPRRILAIPLGLLGLAIVALDGSRTLMLAIGLATAVIVLPTLASLGTRARLAGLAVTAIAGAAVIGGIGPVLERLTDARTLGARAELWGASVEVWLERPFAGAGPGSYPWALQMTDYFDAAIWAPRHPDSLLFQLLPELGILGVVAVTCIVVAFAPTLARSRRHAARWPLLVFALAGIGANPSDFGFLVAVAVAWVALLLPRPDDGRVTAPARRNKATRWVMVPLLVVIGAAYSASIVAGMEYDAARQSVRDHDLASAARHLRRAAQLDPGMGLYWRQLGVAHLLSGETDASVRELRAATEINPSDDLAWRSLALAYRARGDAEAMDALRSAVDAQRSDVTNLLLLAAWSDPTSAREVTSELILGWPLLVAAPGWGETIVTSPASALTSAIDRWSTGGSAPLPVRNQPLLLAALAGDHAAAERARDESDLGEALEQAYVAVTRCDAAGEHLLNGVGTTAMRMAEYWGLVIKLGAQTGSRVDDAVRAYRISTGGSPPDPDTHLNPLNENTSAGFSVDAWGYRRQPITWPVQSDLRLPSPAAGTGRWLFGPMPDLPGTAACP